MGAAARGARRMRLVGNAVNMPYGGFAKQSAMVREVALQGSLVDVAALWNRRIVAAPSASLRTGFRIRLTELTVILLSATKRARCRPRQHDPWTGT